MKIGAVIEYVTRHGLPVAVEVISVVHESTNKYGEQCVTMWVQRIRKTRRKKPFPLTIATSADNQRVVGDGKVLAIIG